MASDWWSERHTRQFEERAADLLKDTTGNPWASSLIVVGLFGTRVYVATITIAVVESVRKENTSEAVQEIAANSDIVRK